MVNTLGPSRSWETGGTSVTGMERRAGFGKVKDLTMGLTISLPWWTQFGVLVDWMKAFLKQVGG